MKTFKLPVSVPVRDIFPDEVADFQPWVESPQGMAELARVLGLQSLSVQGSQVVTTGNKRLDVLAVDDSEKKWAVELFLEPADDSHSWRTVAYLANLRTDAAVLVVPELEEFHRVTFSYLRSLGVPLEVVLLEAMQLGENRWPVLRRLDLGAACWQSRTGETAPAADPAKLERVKQFREAVEALGGRLSPQQPKDDSYETNLGNKFQNTKHSFTKVYWSEKLKRFLGALCPGAWDKHMPQIANRQEAELVAMRLAEDLGWERVGRNDNNYPGFHRDYGSRVPTMEEEASDVLKICKKLCAYVDQAAEAAALGA